MPSSFPALLLTAAAALSAQPLADAVRARIGDFPGTVGIYARNLDTGASFGLHETQPVRTASTIKLPVLCSVFDAVARGQAKWTEPLTVTAAEKAAGSGIIASEISDGVQLPLGDVAHLMIALSDNTATNLILQRFGTNAVNAYLDRIGIRTTRSLRKISKSTGISDAGKLPQNSQYGIGVSTPRDMVTILERLEQGEIVSPEASSAILAVLKRCQDNTGIRRRAGEATVANKTGALDALRADVGIVYAQSGRIAMAIYVDGIPKPDWTPDNPGSLLIADLSRILVDGLAKPRL